MLSEYQPPEQRLCAPSYPPGAVRRCLGLQMGEQPEFMKGDLVSYMDDGGTMGIVVESRQEQLKLPFVYTIRWLRPYEIYGKTIIEDEVYADRLKLLARVKK